jgi:nucleotide-binding universal stress UspA family protein
METVVVGVDGSESSRAALALAAREASLRNARLRVVVVWEIPFMVYGGAPAFVDAEDRFNVLRAQSERLADESLAIARTSQPSVDCEAVVLSGQPAELCSKQPRMPTSSLLAVAVSVDSGAWLWAP